jgi:hypothetical protein
VTPASTTLLYQLVKRHYPDFLAALAERRRRLAPLHQARAGAGQEDEHRRAKVGDPAREEQRGAHLRVRHRVLLDADDEVVAHVVERHNEDDEATQRVDAVEAVLAGCHGRPRPLA